MRQNKQNSTAVSLYFPASAPDSLLADVGGAADVLVGGDEERRVHGAGAADDAALQHRARLGAQREAAALVIVRLVRVAAGPRAVTAVNTRWRMIQRNRDDQASWVVMWVVIWHIRSTEEISRKKRSHKAIRIYQISGKIFDAKTACHESIWFWIQRLI